MSDSLIVRCRAIPRPPSHGSASIAAASSRSHRRRAMQRPRRGKQRSSRRLLVPGEDVLHLAATLPSGSDSRLAQLLPFALEEQVAEDIESQHFAVGPSLPDGTTAVDVVARARMDEWLALQAEWGVTVRRDPFRKRARPEVEGHLVLLIDATS